MRIAIVGPAHPYKGGGARHTTELAHRLAAAGHDVIIESWRAQYPRRLYPGQQTVDVPEGEPYPRTRRRLAWYRPDGWLAEGRRLKTADLVVFVLLTRAGTVITHSAVQAAQAKDLAPGATVRTVAMPPHLPATARQDNDHNERGRVPHPAHCRLLFFGLVRPYKGLDLLLRALAQAPPRVTLTVAGEFWGGTEATEKLIADLGLTDRVTLRPGYVPADQIPALFAAADALVLPYREATASQNALLAFANGVPVVTTTAGALAESVRDGVDGLTCAPGDVEDLLRVLTAISDPATLSRLRAGVPAVDPDPAWAAYLRVLLAG